MSKLSLFGVELALESLIMAAAVIGLPIGILSIFIPKKEAKIPLSEILEARATANKFISFLGEAVQTPHQV